MQSDKQELLRFLQAIGAGFVALLVTAFCFSFAGSFALLPGLAAAIYVTKYVWEHPFVRERKELELPEGISDEYRYFLIEDRGKRATLFNPHSKLYPVDLAIAMSQVKRVIGSYELKVGSNVSRFSFTNLDQNEGLIEAQLQFQQYIGGSLTEGSGLEPSAVAVTVRFYCFEEGTAIWQGYRVATCFNVGTPRKIIEQMQREIDACLSMVAA
jgi:hypothetical protein